ncbi:protein yellow-like [Achroia grisella]|uniref:protein yellow-like n=1 Tax=Achroia grisella TaxID=688607 RepID=UPI0027D20C96|nr:protein yellow-like [Achroia grisella]
MALSHQWFIQWSPPSMVINDINNQYSAVNNWNKGRNKLEWQVTVHNSEGEYNSVPNIGLKDYPDYYGRKSTANKKYDRSQAAGFALWLTMLGVASSQTIPADLDTPPFSTLYKWKQIDFEFPSMSHRWQALSTGKYIPENVLPLGLEVWGHRVFITVPRWRRGIPATVATVSRYGGVTSPPLKPYPNWQFNNPLSNGRNCSGLTSVFRVHVDPCGRLWVLDSGQIDSVDKADQVCPPSLLVFDLQTDTLIARYTIPKKYVLEDSLYANLVIDTRTEDCSDVHVYIADTWRFGLLVFRERDEKFWRFSHPLFFPDPLASNFTLHGLNFQWTDGIFGLSLSPIDIYTERILYFHSMSSYREFYVSTAVLQDPMRVKNSSSEFNLAGESRGLSGQSSASAIDDRGVMFYGLVTRDSIGCWDTKKPYTKVMNGVVAKNSETLIFPNDIKIDQEERQNVWVISNRLPMYQSAPLNADDYNYRLMFADAVEAVRGTICDPEI